MGSIVVVSVRLCIGVIDEDRAVDVGRGVEDGGAGGLSKDYNNIVDPGYSKNYVRLLKYYFVI